MSSLKGGFQNKCSPPVGPPDWSILRHWLVSLLSGEFHSYSKSHVLHERKFILDVDSTCLDGNHKTMGGSKNDSEKYIKKSWQIKDFRGSVWGPHAVVLRASS